MLYGFLSLAAAAVLVGIDQWLKAWATANLLPVGAMPLIPGVVELRYSLNQGMAFSLLWGQQGFLIAVTSLALLALTVYLFCRRPPLAERIAWTMVLGGGVGNLIDRVAAGQVVDYINLQFIDFAIFNFADICVTGGIALLFIAILAGELRAGKKPAAAPEDTGADGAPPEKAPAPDADGDADADADADAPAKEGPAPDADA